MTFENMGRINRVGEYIKDLTSKWAGERFEDGRPKVSDDLLPRFFRKTVRASMNYKSVKIPIFAAVYTMGI